MKKVLVLILMFLVLFAMTACGDSGTDSNGEPNNNDNASVENNTNGDVYFKDNEVKINDLKIKITETKVIPVGETGNEYGDKPVFAIWYETTNLTDEEIDPSTAWISIFTAIQDNNPNSINELEMGALPDEKYLDSQLETIKKDGTVENAVAYELDDSETPVTLVANQGIVGDEIGRQDYEIK